MYSHTAALHPAASLSRCVTPGGAGGGQLQIRVTADRGFRAAASTNGIKLKAVVAAQLLRLLLLGSLSKSNPTTDYYLLFQKVIQLLL